MGGLSSGLLGRSSRAAGPKESRADRPREGRRRVLCPTSAKVRGARDSAAAIRGQRLGGGGGGGGGGNGRRGKTAAGGGRQRRGHCYSGTKTRGAGTPGSGERTRLPRRHVGRGQLPAVPAPARRGAGPQEQVLGAESGVRESSGILCPETREVAKRPSTETALCFPDPD